MKILITGSAGFIGSAICYRLASDNKMVGVDVLEGISKSSNMIWEKIDITKPNSAAIICKRYIPDVVIHCAGIAHQKIGAVSMDTYKRVNSEATEKLAIEGAKSNPDLQFLFLSSVSVYGENNLNFPVGEESECFPSSAYAFSKLDAEKRLLTLVNKGIMKKLIILRLAPVYDREWSLNLDRRVFAPKKIAHLKFGYGQQKMSALARPNLVALIQFLLQRHQKNKTVEIMNVCDAEPYEFNEIIRIFKNSNRHPNRLIIKIPLPVVWLATRIAGLIMGNKKKWIHSCYNKLSSSLVFDNTKMLETGFKPRHSLQTIFLNND
ncbi:NAD-dependent epimerase/dehydratase family protein [Thermodesulfobacteriota bacterium]